MIDNVPTYDTAEALRKSQNYKDAGEQFAQLWQQRQSPSLGWRYAYCLRKQGNLQEAEAIIRAALEKFPEDKFTKSELGWILYEKELKPAKEESDLGRVVHFANEILALNSDQFALRLVSMTVIKVAKGRKKWDIALEWTNKLNPEDLSTESKLFEGRRVMSDREIWLVSKARALFETEHYTEAREFAQQGMQQFPNELYLARTAALALAKLGDTNTAVNELRSLLSHPRADWYVKADLAGLEYTRGNYADAYQMMCDAAANSNDDEYKLKCFVTLGRIALALGRNDVAAEHVALAKAVRTENNWSIPTDLVQLEKETQAALTAKGEAWPTLPSDSDSISRICHQRWREGKVEGLEFIKGRLGQVSQDKPFAFIKRDDGGENVFVIVKDIPRKCAHEGASLEFTLKKSFDKKKNRESVQAANIRCAKE